MTQKSNVKNKMNFHEMRKFQFNDQKILVKNTFDEKKIDMTIVQFDDKANDVEIFNIQSHLILKKIFETKMTKTIDVDLINDLRD